MQPLPKRNAPWRVVDIKPSRPEQLPESKKEEEPERPIDASQAGQFIALTEEFKKPNYELVRRAPLREDPRPKYVILAFLVLSAAVISVSLFSSYRHQSKVLSSASATLQGFQSAVEDLKGFDSQSAKTKFLAVDQGLGDILSEKRNPLFQNQSNLLNNILPAFKDIGTVLKRFRSLAGKGFLLAETITDLNATWPNSVFRQEGDRLIAKLSVVNETISAITSESGELAAIGSKLSGALPVNFASYLPFQLDLNRVQNFLNAFIPWLKSSSTHHIALFFQNTSEMRPGGGFLGSFADITIENGNLKNIEVHDINDADRKFEEKIVPPKPLQAFRNYWRAADANWFFNFPDSAAKALEFLELSDLYKASSTAFDGAVAVSPRVIRDLLELTGPIEIPGEKLSITKDNFLQEIQKQIEESRNSRLPAPKAILQKLTPLLLEKLSRIASDSGSRDLSGVHAWLAKKDMMFYFKDQALQSFFDHYGWTGSVLGLPQDFNGDYLAVVNANVNGGKTDIVIEQNVLFQSQIDLSGAVTNHLEITREHQGKEKDASWYKVPNQAYIKVFTPLSAALIHADGGIEKKIKAPLDYEKEGFRKDALVENIESTMRDFLSYPAVQSFEESGKNVFAVWSKVDRGKTAKLVFDYKRDLFAPPRHGQAYQFVFEKQSGASSTYVFEINAPIGFVWRENKLPAFEYKSGDPDGRVVIRLTLSELK